MSLLSIISTIGGSISGSSPGGGGGPYNEPTIEGVVYTSPLDVAGYNGFPYPLSNVSDGSLITFWKKSGDHAGAGLIKIARSIDGGANWVTGTVKVDGVDQTNDTLTLYKMRTSDYIIMAYQTFAVTPNVVYFARILESDLLANPTAPDFTSCGSVTFSHANHKGYNFDNPIELPSGKLRMCYYTFPDGGYTGGRIGWIDSEDNGATWAEGPIIVSKSGGAFPNGLVSESCPVITHMGTLDSNTKVVVLSRNEEYGYWTHSASADGGETWTTDTTWNFGYEFDGAISSIPVSSMLHNGMVYCVIGSRDAPGAVNDFKLQWLIIDPDDLFANTHPLGVTANEHAYVPNSSTYNVDVIHWGYPILFKDWAGELWCQVYDYVDGGYIENKLKIHQLKIAEEA